jgi:geranylgeranyl reductase family protein
MHRFDVVVVGAGPAGSTVAIPLARSGLDVLILDKDAFPRDKPCGDFVGPMAVDVLRDLGCLPAVEQHNCLVVERSRVYIEDDLAFEGQVQTSVGFSGYGYIVPRLDLDQVVLEHAIAAGATAVDACTVTGFALEPGGIQVSARRHDREETFHARVIVGADGANSIVAESAGLAMRDPRYVMASQRAYAEGLDLDGQCVIWFTKEYFPGYGWAFPTADGRVNIGVGLVSELARKHRVALPEFMRAMREVATRWAAQRGQRLEMGPAKGWMLKTYGGMARTQFERGLLVGDAGSFIDPISGQGIASAMLTAQMAAATIRAAFAAGDFSERFLSRYQVEWQKRLGADLALSDLVVSTVRNRYLAHQWMTSLRIMCETARRYPDCATRLGGVFTGAVGARAGLAPDILLKSVLHGPRFWLELLGIERGASPTTAAARLLERAAQDLGALAAMAGDSQWSNAWSRELMTKQLEVLGELRRAQSGR